jgi:peptide/nickel transport system substrate-binding protein
LKNLKTIAAILTIFLLGSMFGAAFAAGNPPISPLIKRPMSLDEATIEDGSPETVDPSWAYDTASAEMIFNVYDTLITFDAEHMERYLPSIATDGTLETLATVSPEGIPWYWRYTFEIRGPSSPLTLDTQDLTAVDAVPPPPSAYNGVGSPVGTYWEEDGTDWQLTSWIDTDFSGDLSVSDDVDLTRACRNHQTPDWKTTQYFHVDAVPLDGTVPYTMTITEKEVQFQAPWFYELTPTDVEYSFERTMVQDRSAGPSWMLYEPLFNSWGAAGLGNGNLSDPVNVALVGRMIDHSVESNATHVWFNIGFPGAYAPFYQILCQSWASIMSKQWIVNYVIGDLDRPEWNGEFGGDYLGWVAFHDPAVSPLDDPTPVMYGSGPFCLYILDHTAKTWILNRFHEYWRGWPATFPTMAGASPAGYVESMSSTWLYGWAARKGMFLAGDVDLCAVPRSYLSEMYKSPTPPYAPPNYPLDGLRCVMPLPQLACDAIFFTYDISPATLYGKINDYGVYSLDGIPRDFFGSAADGKHVRAAFASAFDYDTFLATAYLGEAMHPATAIIPGLLYYDPTVQGWTYNLTRATLEFQACPTLWSTGFTIQVLYNTGNVPRMIAAQLLETAIEGINPGKFFVDIVSVAWTPYLRAAIRHQLGLFIIGWLADYPDPHNFAFSFYHTYGSFPLWQLYSNPDMDALVEAGIQAPDGPARAAIYRQIQLLAVEDVPSTTIVQAIGRHFERDWLVGWYYNPIYPGLYGYNLWKWYYVPHVLMDPVVQPTSFFQPADINYDGKCDMKDIGTTAKSFGATAGPPIHTRWIFRADFNGDRKIDMKDIGYVAKNFGKQGPKWVPTP